MHLMVAFELVIFEGTTFPIDQNSCVRKMYLVDDRAEKVKKKMIMIFVVLAGRVSADN